MVYHDIPQQFVFEPIKTKMKYCPKCKIEKNIKEFSKSIQRKDGLKGWCKDCSNIAHKEYHITHKKAEKIYRQKNREHLLKCKKEDYIKNKEKRKKLSRIYRRSHKKELTEYFRNRRKSDLNFKLLCYLRSRIYSVLKGFTKSNTTKNLVGCSIDKLKKHLETKFDVDMSWSNYGSWHVDHIIPCASFDMSKIEDQKKCFHYTNLQPLWAEKNWNKGSNVQ